jgi:queuosine precursor transporter
MSATGVYIGTLIIANVTAGKLFSFAGVAISAGAFAYLICLATSDVIVDIYGPSIGYGLVRLATIMNVVALGFGQLAVRLPIARGQEGLQPHFAAVFNASAAIIVASIIGFPITDAFETYVWKRVKTLTGGRHLWLRNAVVKVPGQLLDATVFFTLAFFILPQLFYGKPIVATSAWWPVMTGAWLYGLWKGCLGTLNYPIIRALIPWIRAHRESDISSLGERVEEEASIGRW